MVTLKFILVFIPLFLSFEKSILAEEPVSVPYHFLGVRTIKKSKQEYLSLEIIKPNSKNIPESFDWRTKAKLTPVRDQEFCASSWAFSLVVASELASVVQLKQKPIEYSVQALMDCVDNSDFKNYSCCGTFVVKAAQYTDERGMILEQDYPYQAIKGKCQYTKNHNTKPELTPHVKFGRPETEKKSGLPTDRTLMSLITEYGPLVALLNLPNHESTFNISYHGKGVMDQEPGKDSSPNHAVLLVGWGQTNGGTPFWIIRNSWGPKWGDEGYGYIKRGGNVFGLKNYILIPVARKPTKEDLQLESIPIEPVEEENAFGGPCFEYTPEFRRAFLAIPIYKPLLSLNKFVPPNRWDWREHHKVSPVKNQFSCGSCWAFAASAAIESSIMIRKNLSTMIELSPQELVDCTESVESSCHGCCGGFPNLAMDYTMHHGLATLKEYSYTKRLGKCKKIDEKKKYFISNYTRGNPIRKGDSTISDLQMKQLIHELGPVAVSVDATNGVLHGVTDNIVDIHRNSTSLSHVVTIVGWDRDNGTEYWIVKNSWGNGWGVGGYFKVLIDNDANVLGINHAPAVPIV